MQNPGYPQQKRRFWGNLPILISCFLGLQCCHPFWNVCMMGPLYTEVLKRCIPHAPLFVYKKKIMSKSKLSQILSLAGDQIAGCKYLLKVQIILLVTRYLLLFNFLKWSPPALNICNLIVFLTFCFFGIKEHYLFERWCIHDIEVLFDWFCKVFLDQVREKFYKMKSVRFCLHLVVQL